MKSYLLLLVKGVLWLLLVLLLRPINYLMDVTLAAYFNASDKTKELELSRKTLYLTIAFVLALVGVLFFTIYKLNG